MHLMATYLPVLILCALSTSENVPSPFLLINLYSISSNVKDAIDGDGFIVKPLLSHSPHSITLTGITFRCERGGG